MKLADVSISRPVLATVLNFALLVFGLVAFPNMGVDLFPNTDIPVVTVTAIYPGADPETVETKVVDKLEEQLNTINGLDKMSSFSLENVGQIVVMFDLETDGDQAAQDVRDKVSATLSQLPSDLEAPVVQKLDLGAEPILTLALAGPQSIGEITQVAEDDVKARLQKLRGVGSVEIVGGQERQVNVWVDPQKLSSYGLTIQDLAQAVGAQNLEIPGGRVKRGGEELVVKTKGEVHSVASLENVILRSAAGAPLHLRDVARVEDGTEEARSSSDLDGQRAVSISVVKQSGANAVAVAHVVKDELEAIRADLPEGMKLTTPRDGSAYIEASINDVQFDLLLGAILTVIIISIFLRDWRATIISAIALPTSVIASIGFMWVMGFTFNTMTMLALTLSIGMLIDDAIVVIENIHRHLEMGKPPMQAAREATAEIGLAVMAITAAIIAVFVPVAIMKGMIGKMFFEFGMTVSFAVAVSLLVSFTLTPMLSARFLKVSHDTKPNILSRGIEAALDALDRAYRRVLAFALRRKALVLVGALAVLAGSFGIAAQLDQEMIPESDRGELKVMFELPAGTSLEETERFGHGLRDEIAAVPGVTSVLTTVGGGARGQVNKGEIHVNLVDRHERTFKTKQAIDYIRAMVGKRPPAILSVEEYGMVSASSTGMRNTAVQFTVTGTNLAELQQSADQLVERLEATPGFVDVGTSSQSGKPELTVTIDRDRAAELGVPVASVAMTVRTLLAGEKVSDLKLGDERVDIRLRVDESFGSTDGQLASIKARGAGGQLVELGNVVRLGKGSGPTQIERTQRQRKITVMANVEGLALGDAMNQVEGMAAEVVPASQSTQWEGMADMMGESFRYMFQSLILAIILVYLILAAQFESWIHPLTIMLSLPFIVIGAFGALYLFDYNLSIFAFIGLIMLVGLVTKNAVLLVDYTNTLRARGLSTLDALLEAGPVRLRPILMTTAAMIFGMLPVALGRSMGGELRAPMAIAVIGGLITSTLLTLIVVPVVYALLDRVRLGRKDKAAEPQAAPAAAEAPLVG